MKPLVLLGQTWKKTLAETAQVVKSLMRQIVWITRQSFQRRLQCLADGEKSLFWYLEVLCVYLLGGKEVPPSQLTVELVDMNRKPRKGNSCFNQLDSYMELQAIGIKEGIHIPPVVLGDITSKGF